MPDLALSVSHEHAADTPAVERLHERAFGPGRFARTAFRLREGVAPLADLSFVARVGTLIVGAVRLTPIHIGAQPALLLGPLTVDPSFMGRGIGTILVDRSLDAARGSGHRLALLVGDEPFYGRFGFRRVPAGRVVLPGPVDPARLLWADLVEGAAAEAWGAVSGG
jgi:predicted N-acetyltransferase YhbS